MKKIVFTLLCLCMVITTTACSTEKSSGTDPNISFDNITEIPATSIDADSISSTSQSSDLTFEISDKLYSYNDATVALVKIKNNSDAGYSLSLTGTFLDSQDNELGREEQTFEQFAPNHERYFLFQPNISFEKIRYEINVCEYPGICYASMFSATFVGLKENPWGDGETLRPSIASEIVEKNTSPVLLDIGFTYLVLFDSKGDIITICRRGRRPYVKTSPNEKNEISWGPDVYVSPNEKLIWPEKYKNKVTGIIVFEYITPSKEE